MAETDTEKTEEPTSKRLEDARNRGQVAVSKEVNTWAILFGLGAMIVFVGPWLFLNMMPLITPFLSRAHEIPMDPGGLGGVLFKVTQEVGLLLLAPVGMMMILGVVAGVSQSGFLFTTYTMKPAFNKISPLSGLKRMFSLRQLVEFGKGMAKIFVVGLIGGVLLAPELGRLEIIPSMPLDELLEEVTWLILKFLIAVLLVLIVVVIADVSYQNYEHHKSLKMTKQEVKEEQKSAEGDPLIKARLRRIRMERHRGMLRQAMERATVLVTNPTHYAVALEYDMDVHVAPIVIAKGQDFMALQMRELAAEFDVPIFENPPLARKLYEVPLDQPIPMELFEAVSQIIRYIMGMGPPPP